MTYMHNYLEIWDKDWNLINILVNLKKDNIFKLAITKEKSILIIAPSLLAESLSLKLTSLDNDLKISLDPLNDKFIPN